MKDKRKSGEGLKVIKRVKRPKVEHYDKLSEAHSTLMNRLLLWGIVQSIYPDADTIVLQVLEECNWLNFPEMKAICESRYKIMISEIAHHLQN